MNEQYVKSFVERFKREIGNLMSIKIELETVIEFKDAEISDLRKQIEDLLQTKLETETV